MGYTVCLFASLYNKKERQIDELQDAREKRYQELLLELTAKFTIVNAVNEKLDNLCTAYHNQSKT